MIATMLLAGAAWAAVPELVVVGAHIPGLTGEAAKSAAVRLAEAADATGKVDALAPDEVRVRISGREALILDLLALGPGRDALREGKILYDRAQPDQAIPVLEQATRLLATGLATSTDLRDLHEALTLLGLAHAGLGDEPAARAAFRRSVVLDPSRQLDAVNYPPQIVALHNEVRRQAAAEPVASLTVSAANASMWIDGRQTPPGEMTMVPGEHHLLLRGADGATAFQTFTLAAGEQREIAPVLTPRAVGWAASDTAGRSRQTRDLYRSIGQYTDRDPVLVVGHTVDRQVALQVYAPASGNFSRALTADGGSDPISALVDLVPAAVGFLTESGDIKSDRVSPQVISLDIGGNVVLDALLFEPARPTAAAPVAATAKRKGAPWYLWAGLGALAAGGGATAAVLLTSDTNGGDNGTVTFGPLP